jgi:hypothetical protein
LFCAENPAKTNILFTGFASREISLPVAASERIRLLSAPEETIRDPSGEKAMVRTGPR